MILNRYGCDIGSPRYCYLIDHVLVQLHDILTDPPSGYRFVPKGDVYVTRH
jgi:hypothetical protein